MMGGRRSGDLLLGQDSERPLVNRLTFILSFFMLTTGYVFYYSFYGCPFELKSLKLENKIEEEVKEKTFYENLLTIIYGEDRDGQAVNAAEEEKKWSELVSEWWNFSGDETKSTDIDDLELVKEIPYNNSIKVLFQSLLKTDTKNTNSMGATELKSSQTNESLKESEPEQPWSLLSFNFASAATLPHHNTETEEEEPLNFFDFIEKEENIEEEESVGNVLNIFQCDKVTENNECQAQIIKAEE